MGEGRKSGVALPDSLIQTSSVAEAYWALHDQLRDGWTHELDLRPYSERW